MEEFAARLTPSVASRPEIATELATTAMATRRESVRVFVVAGGVGVPTSA
jgi:pseudouridine-5'-phosphate glycosidase